MSSIRQSVSLPDETPRSSSKKLRCASYFNSLLNDSSGDETLRLMLDILHKLGYLKDSNAAAHSVETDIS